MRRYARVSTTMGGVAARMAGERFLGVKADRAADAAALKEALGGLKGPLMKVAQLLSTLPEALPKEYAQELAELQANAPRMGWPFVKRRMAAELGAEWQARFAGFEREAAAAASLGQVHRATALDGRELACKLQYPDMDSAVEADLQQLRVVFAVFARYDRAIDPSDLRAEIAARLREELDYGREARNMALYRTMLAGEAGVVVPEVVADLSTRRLLTMTWCGGRHLLDVVGEPLERRNLVAYNLFRAWYVPFYEYGVIHGDPHLGNYTVRPDGSVNLYDFGAVRVFRPPFVEAVIELYHALRDGDRDRAVAAYRTWGFTNLTNDVIDALNLWARYVYGPLMQDRVQLIQESGGTGEGRDTAIKVRDELRRLGGVRPPREFLLMDRAAIGLGGVFMHLKAEINWHRLFNDLIAGFDRPAMARRQAEALAAAGIGVAEE